MIAFLNPTTPDEIHYNRTIFQLHSKNENFFKKNYSKILDKANFRLRFINFLVIEANLTSNQAKKHFTKVRINKG